MRTSLCLLTISILMFSCGPTEQEINQRQEFVSDSLKQILISDSLTLVNKEREEAIRIHKEKIEVGKALKKNLLESLLSEINQSLINERAKLNQINEFKFARSLSVKEEELSDQQEILSELDDLKSKVKVEIAELNHFNSFNFQMTPIGTVEYLFQAAKDEDFSKMRYMADPYGECEKDVHQITLAEVMPQDSKQEWISMFKEGRIMGAPKIEGSTAEIEIAIGERSNRLEKITLIKRLDHWYIFSLS